MDFEVSFTKSQQELSELILFIEQAGEDLDRFEAKGKLANSRYAKSVRDVEKVVKQLNDRLMKTTSESDQVTKATDRVREQSYKFLQSIAQGNEKARLEIQALKSSTDELGRAFREQLSSDTYSKWLKKTASEAANLKGQNEYLRASLDHLDNPQRRVNLRLQAMKDHLDRVTVAGKKQELQTAELQQQLKLQSTELGGLNATLRERVKGVNQANTADERQQNQLAELLRQYESLHGGLGEQIARQRELNKQRSQDITLTERQAHQKSELERRIRSLIDGEERQIAILKEQAREQQKAVTADARREAQVRELRRELEYLQSAEGRAHIALQQRVAAERSALQAQARRHASMRVGNQLTASMRAGLAGLQSHIGMYTSSTIAAAAATYALSSALRDTVASGAEFTESMSRAEAIMFSSADAAGVSADQMRSLEAQVRALGQSTVFTATEASGGLIDLAMAGLSGGEALTALKPSLDLASIGMIEMSEAADIATNVMTAFKKDAGELPDVVNVMATAVTNSNTNIQQLANSLSYVGPAAESAGFSMRDTVAAIELLASSGIKGSKAGTGLRRTMLNLLNPTTKGQKVLDKYNISLVNMDGSTRSLTEIMGQFREAMYNDVITPAERSSDIVDLVGVRAQSAFARMASSADDLTVLREQLDNVAGAAERMREKIEDNLSADWKQVKSAFEEIELTVFENFESQLRKLSAQTTVWLHSLNEVADTIGTLGKVDGFQVIDPSNPEGELIDVTQLDVMIARLEMASEAAGIFIATWASSSVFSKASKGLTVLNDSLVRTSDKVRLASARQQDYAKELKNTSGVMSVTTMRARSMAAASSLAASTMSVATVAAAKLATAGRVLSTAFGWVGVLYGAYSMLQMVFGESIADKIEEQKDRVLEAKDAHKEYQEQIEETQHTLMEDSLRERMQTLRKQLELTESRIDQYRSALERLRREREAAGESGQSGSVANLDSQIDNLENRLFALSAQSRDTKDELDGVSESIEKLESSYRDLASAENYLDNLVALSNTAYEGSQASRELARETLNTTDSLAMASVEAAELNNRADALQGAMLALSVHTTKAADEVDRLGRNTYNAIEAFDKYLGELDSANESERSYEALSNARKQMVVEQRIRELRADAIALRDDPNVDPQQMNNRMAALNKAAEKEKEILHELQEEARESAEERDDALADWSYQTSSQTEKIAHLRSEQDRLNGSLAEMERMRESGDAAYDSEHHTELLKERTKVHGQLTSILQRQNKEQGRSVGYTEELEKQRKLLQSISQTYADYDAHVAQQKAALQAQAARNELLYSENLTLEERARLQYVAFEAQQALSASLGRIHSRSQDIADAEANVVALKERAAGLTGKERKDAEEAVNQALKTQSDLVSAQMDDYQTLLDATVSRTAEIREQIAGMRDDRQLVEMINAAARAGKLLDDQNAERLLGLRKARQEYESIAGEIATYEEALESAADAEREHIQEALEGKRKEAAAQQDLIDLLGQERLELSERAESLRAQAEAVEGFFSDTSDAVYDTIRSGFDDVDGMFDSIEDAFKDMLARMIHEAWVNPIIVNVQNSVTDSLGLGGTGGPTAQGGFDTGTIVKGGKAAYDYFFGGSSGTAAVGYSGGGWASSVGTNTYGGWAGNASGAASTSASTSGSSIASSMANAGANFLAAYAGDYVGREISSAVSDKQANSNIGQTIGTVAGSAWGGAPGAFIGSALGSVVDTLFGSGGSDLDIAMRRAREDQYDNEGIWDKGIRAKGGLGVVGFDEDGSHEIADQWDVDEAQKLIDGIAQIDTIFASIADTEEERQAMEDAVLASNRHGIEGHYGETSKPRNVVERLTSRYRDAFAVIDSQFQDLFDGLVDSQDFDAKAQHVAQFGIELDTIEEALAGNATAMAEARAEIEKYAWGLKEYVGAAEAMSKAAQTMDLLDLASQRMGVTFDATAEGAIHAASKLQAAAGGVEQLAALENQFYQQYASQTEQAAHAYSTVYESLRDVTDQVPETTGEFRRLVEAQDLNTEAGREARIALLQIAPAFAQVAGSVEDVITSVYRDVLHREPDTEDLTYWVDQVESGALTVSEALQAIRNSSEAASVAADDAADSIQNQADAARIAEQRSRMEIELLRLQGHETEALARDREMELDALHDSLDPLQQRIWALQDAKEAEEEHAKALDQAQKTLDNFSTSISNWLDRLESTDKGMGSPADQLEAASSAFEKQLEAARNGDRDALGSITQYADRYLSAAQGMFASGEGSQSILEKVTSELGKLPDQLSAEQFLADEIESSLGDQTETLKEAMDLNADGTVSAIEKSIVSGMSQTSRLANILEVGMGDLGATALTAAQVRDILAPHATDDEIKNLIDRVDANGDNILTAEELTSVKLGGMAEGIANALSGSFEMLDENLDGKLTFEELKVGLSGMATDAQLKSIMESMDLNADGVISGLESVVVKSMPTDVLLATVLRNQFEKTHKRQLTREQVREALAPHATDAEIDRLIKRVDYNGDGIVTAEEATALKVSGLSEGVANALSGSFDKLDENLDGKLTLEELQLGLEGLATDAQLKSIMESMDLNTDGIISGLESVVVAGMPTDAVLAGVLSSELAASRDKQLTESQIESALSPIASDAEISRLIERVDANGDGLISAEELTAEKVGGLAAGIASSLSPNFDSLDSNLNGLIDYEEFGNQFSGFASDEELGRIFDLLDVDGDSQIDKLEAIRGNTEALNDLDRFINSQPDSLHDEIESLNNLYFEVLGRVPDLEGLNYWLDKLMSGVSLSDIEKAMKESEESQSGGSSGGSDSSTGGSSGGSTGDSGGGSSGDSDSGTTKPEPPSFDKYDLPYALRDDFTAISLMRQGRDAQGNALMEHASGPLADLYARVLGRDPDRSGFEYWSSEIDGGLSLADVASSMRDSEEYKEGWRNYYAKGGVFTNTVVDSPTLFNEAVMGEAGPEAIMPLKRGPGGYLGVRAEVPPMPELPLLGHNDIAEVVRDLHREVAGLRKENKEMRQELSRHLKGVQAAVSYGLEESNDLSRQGNASLKGIEKAKKMEAMK